MSGFNFWSWESEDSRNQRQAKDFESQANATANSTDANLFSEHASGILDRFYQMSEDVWKNSQSYLGDRQKDASSFIDQATSTLSKVGNPAPDMSAAAPPLPPPDQFRSPDLGGYTTPDLSMGNPVQPMEPPREPGAYGYPGLQAKRDTPDQMMNPVRGMPLGDIPWRPEAPTNDIGQTPPWTPAAGPAGPPIENPNLQKTSSPLLDAWNAHTQQDQAPPPQDSGGSSSPLLDAWNAIQGKAQAAGSSLQQGLGEIGRRAGNEIATSGFNQQYAAAKAAEQTGDVGGVVGNAVRAGASLASAVPNVAAQTADVALGGIGLGRENVSVPNPLAGTGVGNALNVDPNARVGIADAIAAISPGEKLQALQNIGMIGQAVNQPLETAALMGGLYGGGKALGAAASLAKKAGPALAEEAAGQLLGKTPMTAMAEGGLGKNAGLAPWLQEQLGNLRTMADLPQNSGTVDKIIDLSASGKMAAEIANALDPADVKVLGRLTPDMGGGTNLRNSVREVRNAYGIPSQQSGEEAAAFPAWRKTYQDLIDTGVSQRDAALQASGLGKKAGETIGGDVGKTAKTPPAYTEWAPKGSAWEEIPDGTVQPNGLEFRMGMGADGKRYARWPEGKAPQDVAPPMETAPADAGGAGMPPEKPPAPPTGGEPPLPPEQPGVNPIAAGVKQPPPPPAGSKPITLTPDEEVARLRLDKFPEEVRGELENAARTMGFSHDQRRGVIPDQASEDLADGINRTVDQWIKAGKAGKSYNEEETRALRNVLTTQAKKVADLGDQIAAAPTGAERDVLVAKQAAESVRLWGLSQVAEGARAEAGRTLRAYQGETRLIDIDPVAAARRLYEKLGGREKAQQALDEYQKLLKDNADPITLARFWARVEAPPPGITDWFTALRYNSMLSGPRSFEINAIGNTLEIPWRLARDTGASLLRGRPEEIMPEISGMWIGMQKGSQAFMETLTRGASAYRAASGDLRPSLADRVQNPIGKFAANALELPSRGLQAADDFARMTAYSMGLYREAATTASREGLHGKAWSARVADLSANPNVGMQRRALGIADRMTYQNDMGKLGQGLQSFRHINPAVANIAIPFLRTVYNITTRGIDRSPIGFVGTAMDVAKGKYKNPNQLEKGLVPLGERVGDNIMGGMIGLWFINQAAQGNISGSGPDDNQKRDMLRAQGWQPYSVKIGGQWVSYSNWGPVSIPLSMAAAATEGMRYAKPDANTQQIIFDMMGRFGQLATEQTYLQGIGAVYRSISDSERYGGQWLASFMGSLVPYGSALNTIGQMQDPYQRKPDTGDIGQAVAARLPGLREDVSVQKDILGQPIVAPQTGIGALSPFRASAERPNAALQEFTRLGVDVPVSTGKVVAGVQLNTKDARQYQETAQSLRGQLAASLMATPMYQQASDDEKKQMLRQATDRAQAWAAQDIRPGEVDANGNARAGTEWLTSSVGKDPQKAIDGYLSALSVQQQLDALKQRRFMGVSADDADEVAQDKMLIAAYHTALGPIMGDSRAMSEMGATRFMKAKYARENPMYAQQRQMLLRQNPQYALYMQSGPRVMIAQRPSAVALAGA